MNNKKINKYNICVAESAAIPMGMSCVDNVNSYNNNKIISLFC